MTLESLGFIGMRTEKKLKLCCCGLNQDSSGGTLRSGAKIKKRQEFLLQSQIKGQSSKEMEPLDSSFVAERK